MRLLRVLAECENENECPVVMPLHAAMIVQYIERLEKKCAGPQVQGDDYFNGGNS